jgi:G3E family GTPase
MENLLLSFAEQLMRYKGMLWIDGEPNRLLFQGVQRLYSADWDRPWGDETPHSTLVFIGIQLPEEEIRGVCRVTTLTCPPAPQGAGTFSDTSSKTGPNVAARRKCKATF